MEFTYLFCIIRKIYFVINFRSFVLNGLDLDLVRRTLPLSLLDCPLQPRYSVRGDGSLAVRSHFKYIQI